MADLAPLVLRHRIIRSFEAEAEGQSADDIVRAAGGRRPGLRATMDRGAVGRVRRGVRPELLARLQGLDWKARYVMEGFLSGVHGSPFHGPSVEFREYRDYQPGDDLRRVDWRLFARSDRLSVKRFEQETNARCYILCDTSASMAYRGSAAWGSKLECARVLALALGWLLLKQNDAVGLLALARPTAGARATVRYLRPSQKPGQAGLLLRELTGLGAGGGPLLADAPRPRGPDHAPPEPAGPVHGPAGAGARRVERALAPPALRRPRVRLHPGPRPRRGGACRSEAA